MPSWLRFALSLIALGVSPSLTIFGVAQSQPLQTAPCVVEDESYFLPACVVQTRNGALYIPRKYWRHAAFNRYGLSAFIIEAFGNIYINRSGRIVIRDVATMDNGPDDFHHGLVRINRGDKWGFADSTGRIVVPVKYSCALNYAGRSIDSKPRVCVGCRIEQHGEYHSCVDGQWLYTDIRGHLTP